TTDRLSPMLVKAPAGVGFAAVTAGRLHTCGVTAAGTAYCWGGNGFGQLGDGTATNRLTPVLVAAPAGVSFAAVDAGAFHTCGVRPARTAACWRGTPPASSATAPRLTGRARCSCSLRPVWASLR